MLISDWSSDVCSSDLGSPCDRDLRRSYNGGKSDRLGLRFLAGRGSDCGDPRLAHRFADRRPLQPGSQVGRTHRARGGMRGAQCVTLRIRLVLQAGASALVGFADGGELADALRLAEPVAAFDQLDRRTRPKFVETVP